MQKRWVVTVPALAVMLMMVVLTGGSRFGVQAQTAANGSCVTPVASPAASASPSASPAGSPVATPVTACTPVAVAAAPTAATIEARDLYFTPNEVTVAANTKVTLTIKNTGALPHDFYVDKLGVRSALIQPGNSVTVTFTAAPGTYQFYCNQPGHRYAGMVGTIIVK